jgi:outer membrane protein assembly factor BamB
MNLETGEERWTFNTSGGHVWWAPVVNQGMVYVGITHSPQPEALLLSIQA